MLPLMSLIACVGVGRGCGLRGEVCGREAAETSDGGGSLSLGRECGSGFAQSLSVVTRCYAGFKKSQERAVKGVWSWPSSRWAEGHEALPELYL